MSRWTTTTVRDIIQETPNTKRIWLAFPEDFSLEYKAGQFIVAELPIHEKRTQRWRSYSIANAPDGSQCIELCVVKLEGGKGSTYLCDALQKGDTLKIKRPQGVFTLPDNLEGKELIFVCTGTGIAPFRAMLQSLYAENKLFDKAHLIFGTRRSTGILYKEELETLSGSHANFDYSVCLSRESIHPFHKGYVHAIYEKEYAQPQSNRHFYLCGWSNMVDEATQRLKSLGYRDKQIHVELYG